MESIKALVRSLHPPAAAYTMAGWNLLLHMASAGR